MTIMSRIEVQEALRKLQHAEDMASRAPAGADRDALRREIRSGWLTIKPYVAGGNVHAVPA
jgi:hypothetical protein